MSLSTILPRAERGRLSGRPGMPTNLLARMAGLPWAEGLTTSVPVPGISRDIRVKIASTRDEWEQAFQLVADNYQTRGYEKAGADLRFTSYHALPESVVLVAKAGPKVVATLTLIQDNLLIGLPLEGLYRAEVQELRRQGRHIVEAGNLADRDLGTREFVQVFLALMQMGWQYALRNGADTTVVTVNPRHSNFYTRLHGFLPLGPRRAYDRVQGHPAEAFYLDSHLMAARVPEMHQRIFGRDLPPQALAAPLMPEHLIYYFAARSSQTRLPAVEQILWNVKSCGSPRRW